MSYTVELTENERLFLIFSCGCAAGTPPIQSEQSEPPATSVGMARRLIDLKGNGSKPVAPAAAPAAEPSADEQMCSLMSITPTAIERTGAGDKERVIVSFRTGTDIRKASCWAQYKALWSQLEQSKGSPIRLLVKQKGSYLNIVGVK